MTCYFSLCLSYKKKFLESQSGSASSSITYVSLAPLTVDKLIADICVSLRPKNESDVQPLALIISKIAKGMEIKQNNITSIKI